MKRSVLFLVIGIPLAAVLMGIVTVYVAVTHPDPTVELDAPPLSKTSYRDRE